VDKALLIGGQAQPAFGGGKVTEPLSIILAGRATHEVEGKEIPVEEIAVETTRRWLRQNIRHLDADKHVNIVSRIRPGSADLVELFSRFGKGEVPLANDTSFGAGYYPRTYLEKNILAIDALLNSPQTKARFPFVGEDIKVMGLLDPLDVHYTIAIAMVDRYLTWQGDYEAGINAVKSYIQTQLNLSGANLYINTADDYARGSIYLTVTGTSAENGDDGQVGRGNRINGLITPYHPMTLEATSGKNPVSHVGKIYNHFAMDLSRAIVEAGLATEARVYIVSQIGKPINEPQLLHIQVNNQDADLSRYWELAEEKLNSLAQYWRKIVYFG
jgi:S-adenosylmethionine synthetase